MSPDDDELGEHFFNAPLPPYERAWVHPSERAEHSQQRPQTWFDRSAASKLTLFSVVTGLATSIVLLVVALPGRPHDPLPHSRAVTTRGRQSPITLGPQAAPIAVAVSEFGVLVSVIDGVEVGQTVHVSTPEAAEFDVTVVGIEPTLGVSLLKINDGATKDRVVVTPVPDDVIPPGSPVWIATSKFGVELSHISSATPGNDGTRIPLEPFSTSHHGGSVFTNDGDLIGWCVERDGRHWLVPANVARSAVLRLDPDVVQP